MTKAQRIAIILSTVSGIVFLLGKRASISSTASLESDLKHRLDIIEHRIREKYQSRLSRLQERVPVLELRLQRIEHHIKMQSWPYQMILHQQLHQKDQRFIEYESVAKDPYKQQHQLLAHQWRKLSEQDNSLNKKDVLSTNVDLQLITARETMASNNNTLEYTSHLPTSQTTLLIESRERLVGDVKREIQFTNIATRPLITLLSPSMSPSFDNNEFLHTTVPSLAINHIRSSTPTLSAKDEMSFTQQLPQENKFFNYVAKKSSSVPTMDDTAKTPTLINSEESFMFSSSGPSPSLISSIAATSSKSPSFVPNRVTILPSAVSSESSNYPTVTITSSIVPSQSTLYIPNGTNDDNDNGGVVTPIYVLSSDFYVLYKKVQRLKKALACVADAPLSSRKSLVFEGCNIQVLNGNLNKQTLLGNGYGNVVLGYNEANSCLDGSCTRTGSHNLVVGVSNDYTGSGGIVAGESNKLSGNEATITGGYRNVAQGLTSHVQGGGINVASGEDSVVVGGQQNLCSGLRAVTVGGYTNQAVGRSTVVLSGLSNTASGLDASVVSGVFNKAVGMYTTVISGRSNVATGSASFLGGGESNQAFGERSVVAGGKGIVASKVNQVIKGH